MSSCISGFIPVTLPVVLRTSKALELVANCSAGLGCGGAERRL
jgi:hypothetical protein